MPDTSIDLEAYTMAIFRALRRFAASDQVLPTARALYPEMGWRERASLRMLVLPLARKRLAELAEVDRPCHSLTARRAAPTVWPLSRRLCGSR